MMRLYPGWPGPPGRLAVRQAGGRRPRTAIYRANRHPRRAGHPEQSERAVPRREVSGGQFRSSGGRQLMPRRDQTPAEALESDELTADTGPGGRQTPPHETSPG
jgi:hypothetical protein